jgi:glycosyltransferase involved in cell wall biosynthesis
VSRPLRPGFTLVTQYYPPERGAAQVRLGAVAGTLHQLGHEVEVLTAIPNYPTGRFLPGWSRRPLQWGRQDGVPTVRVWLWPAMGDGLARLANYVSFGLTSVIGLAAVRRRRWMVVEYPTLFGALPAVVLARLRGQRLAVNVADLWLDVLVDLGSLPSGLPAKVLFRLERWMLRRAHVVNAATEGFAEAVIAKGVDPARVVLLPNGVDAELFSPGEPDPVDVEAVGLAEGEQLVLYAGTHGYVHGLDVLLDAAEALQHLPVRFLLVGDGSERDRLIAEAERRGLDRVSFWEPVPLERVASLLRLATIGVACVRPGDTYRTIRSAKMFPIMSSGTPVIYSGDDEGSGIVERSGAGIRTPAGDAPALVAALERLLADPAERAELGRAGREHVLATSTWEAIVGRWLEAIDRIEPDPSTHPAAPASEDAP